MHDSRFSKMPASLERTMNGDNTITGAKSAQRARNKELSKIDQIRGLELAVMEYKKDANDKNWSTIDKILQVRKKRTIQDNSTDKYSISIKMMHINKINIIVGFGKDDKCQTILFLSDTSYGSAMGSDG